MSLDGTGIRGVQDWMGMSALLDKKILQNSSDSHYFKGFGAVDSRKGYCVPNALLGDSKKVEYADNQSVCPYDLTAFVKIHCFDMIKSEDVDDEDGHIGSRENALCLNTKDIVKLEKCGNGWGTTTTNGSSCTCLQVSVYIWKHQLVFSLCLLFASIIMQVIYHWIQSFFMPVG